jgi:mitochondrial import inner membrane translocase subunit TIM16
MLARSREIKNYCTTASAAQLESDTTCNNQSAELIRHYLSDKNFPSPARTNPNCHLTLLCKNIMAIGPIARIVAQLIVPIVAVLARALPAAYAQALQNARKAGVEAAEASAPVFGKRISRSEALQVLNLTEEDIAANPEAIQKVRTVFERLENRRLCFSRILAHLNYICVLQLLFQQFQRYFNANDVSKGGSFYLQSKIYRAHELLIEFNKDKRKEDREQQKKEQSSKQ